MRLILPLLAMATALPMAAHAADAPCPAVAPPPAELAGWAQRQPLAAGRRIGGDETPAIPLGQAADVTLSPVAKIDMASPLGKAPGPNDMAGLLVFHVPLSGTYRIALGAGAWIDIVQAGKSIASVAHAHGPDCTGIRKMVDFQLPAGTYFLQLSGASAATLPVMIVRLR